MSKSQTPRERWGPYDGVILAVIVVRLCEPLVRIPLAARGGLGYSTWTVGVLATVVNLTVIARLRRRKRLGLFPVYTEGWYRQQIAFGLVLTAVLAWTVPPGDFAGRRIASWTWEDSVSELFTLQVLLGCSLIGFHKGMGAIPKAVVLVAGWYTLCIFINRGNADPAFALSGGFWAFINTSAGALGGRVLTRMADVGDIEAAKSITAARGALPAEFESTIGTIPRLSGEINDLLERELPEIRIAVERASPSHPLVRNAWTELTTGKHNAVRTPVDVGTAVGRALHQLSEVAVSCEVATFGLEATHLTALEERYIEAYLHTVVANAQPPRSHVRSMSLVVDVDRQWLRLRTVVLGDVLHPVPSDGLLHSVLILHVLTALLRGSLAITRVDGTGELMESRLPRSTDG